MTMWFQGAFQQDANGLTPAEIARRRAVAEVLMGGFGRAQNVGEGAADLMTGIALGIQNRRNKAAEKSGREGAAKLFSSLFQSQSPASSPEGMSFNDLIGAKSGTSSGISDGGPAVSGSNVKQALLDAIAGKESAGRYDVMYGGGRFSDFGDHPRKAMPIKSGPNAGKTSSAAGRYQFLGKTWDQYRNKLGLPDFSPASQDAAAWALASDVYKGKTGNDLQQALASGDPNTIAGVGKALAGTWTSLPGGIEQGQGTNQFVSAYQKALGTPSAVAAINQAAPVQVASLDPSVGMVPAPTPAPKPVQTAQAGGGYPPAPMAPGAQQGTPMGGRGPSFQALMEAMQNPWLDEAQRQIIGGLLQKQLNPPAPQFEEVGGRLVRVNPDGSVTEAYNPGMSPADQARMDLDRQKFEFERNKPLTVGGDSRLADPSGRVLLDTVPKSPELPSAVREYEYAKSQGFPGTFQDWEASKKGGMSLQVDPATGAVTFQQGGNIKPMTEGQSKDAVFSTRAEGSLPIIDQYGDALTRFGESVGGAVPGVGNYLKSDEFQKAEQAGNEFLQAILRKDTGAAITSQEMTEYGTVYLPRPGDGPEVLAQKKASRLRALEAMKAGMPPQAILAQEKALAKTQGATSPGKRLKFNPETGELE